MQPLHAAKHSATRTARIETDTRDIGRQRLPGEPLGPYGCRNRFARAATVVTSSAGSIGFAKCI